MYIATQPLIVTYLQIFFVEKFKRSKDGLKACRCPEPCIHSEFIAKVSHYRFPNENYIKEIAGPLKGGRCYEYSSCCLHNVLRVCSMIFSTNSHTADFDIRNGMMRVWC